MKKASSNAQAYSVNIKNGTGTIQAYANSQKSIEKSLYATSEAAKSAGAGTKAFFATLNTLAFTAIFSLISKGISWVTEQIDKFIRHNELAIEKAEQLYGTFLSDRDTIKTNEEKLRSYSEEFDNLSKGVDDLGRKVSLSSTEYARYQSIVKEIVAINPSLIAGYDDQNNVLAVKNGLIEQSIQLLKNEYNQKLDNLALPENINTTIEGASSKYKEAENKFMGIVPSSKLSFSGIKIDPTGKKQSGLLLPLDSYISDVIGVKMSSSENYNTYILHNAEAIFNNLDKIQERASQSKDGYMGLDDSQLIELMDYFIELRIAYNDMNNASTSANPTLQYVAMAEDSYEELTDVQKKFVTDYINGIQITSDITDQEKANIRKDIILITNELSNLPEGSDVNKALESLYYIPDSSIQVNEYLNNVEGAASIIKDYCEENAIEVPISLIEKPDQINNQINSVKKILLDDYDDLVEELSVGDLEIASEKLDLDPNIQLSWDELITKINEYKEKMAAAAESEANFEKLTEDADSCSKAMTSTISSMDALSSAMQEQKQNGELSLKTIDDLINSGYATALQFDDETNACTINTDALRELLKLKLLNQKLDLIKLQTNIAEELEKEGIAATAAANGYISLAKGKTAAQIALVTQHNNVTDQIKLLDKINIDDILSGDFTSGFKSGAASSTSYQDEFNKDYNTLKHLLEMGQLTEKEYYDNVAALNQQYFAGKKEYLDDYRRYEEEVYKGLQSYYKTHVENQMRLLEGQLDAGKINYRQYVSAVTALLQKLFNEGKISAADYYSYEQKLLEKQKDIYDRALSAVANRLEKEIDYWQNLIDGVKKQNEMLEKQKDNYDSILSVVDEVYQKEIDAIKEKQEAIDKQIDSLKKANEEEELSQNLANAKLKLEQSRKNRTRLVYDGESGQYVYKVDTTAVRESEKGVQDLELEQKISTLEKERDSLNESIEKLEHYRSLWSEITGLHQSAINQQLAKDLWGEDYESLILSNRLTDIESFRDNYLDLQSTINDNTALIESYETKVEYYNGLKDKWAEISSSYEEGIDAQMAAALLGQEWEADVLSGRLDKLNSFKTEYENLQQEIVDAAWQSTNEQIRAAEEAQKGADGKIGSGVITKHDNTPKPDNTSESEQWGLFNARNNQLIIGSLNSRQNAEKLIPSAANEIGGSYNDIIIKKYHNGLLGDYPSSASPALQSTIKQVGTRRLSPDEFLAVLQKKELVINPSQQKTLLNNISSLGNSLLQQQFRPLSSGIRPAGTAAGQNITYNFRMGDVNLQGVQNVEDFGAEIGRRFKNVMYQNLHSMQYR